jgi:lipopolysaccharide export system permease protein
MGGLNASLLFQMVGLEMLRQLSGLAPPAFLFSVLYSVGRMYRDSEITALESCAVSDTRLLRAVFLTVVPIALLVSWLSLQVSPWSARQIDYLLSEQQGDVGLLEGINPGRFNEYSGGDLVFYVEEFIEDGEKMKNLFVHHRHGGDYDLISAETGYQKYHREYNGHYFVFENGFRYEGEPGTVNYRVSQFDLYAIRLTEGEPLAVKKPWRGYSNQQLLASEDIRHQTEFQLRLSSILSLFTLALMAFPLSRSAPRKSPYGRMVVAVLFYVFYFSLQGSAKKWMLDGATPTWMGLWWVHLSVVILALPLYLTQTHQFKRIRRQLLRAVT